MIPHYIILTAHQHAQTKLQNSIENLSNWCKQKWHVDKYCKNKGHANHHSPETGASRR